MHDIMVLWSGDNVMCMTLSGHTSTLPRLVVWGAGFQGHYILLDSAQTQFCGATRTHYDRGCELLMHDKLGLHAGMMLTIPIL